MALGLLATLRDRGLYDANIDIGATVPQGVDASLFHQIDPRWALSGSVGWQQWLSELPVALGRRGDLVGAHENAGVFFMSANFNGKF